MPLEIAVQNDPDHLYIRYSGRISTQDIHTLVSGMERGEYPSTYNLLHDMRAAQSLDLPGPDAVSLSFRRRATIPQDVDHIVHAAVLGASEQIIHALEVWRNLFYPRQDHYQMRICADLKAAKQWISS